MNTQDLLKEAAALQAELQTIRRDLHEHPEIGFDMVYTKPLVKKSCRRWGMNHRIVAKRV